MTLQEQLKQDMVHAMKEKDKDRLAVIRMVKAAVDLEHINMKCDVTDELVLDVLSKQIKMRNDSISEFEKAGRYDLVNNTKKELEVLMIYMPEQLSQEEINQVLDEAFVSLKPEGPKDMGKVMKEVSPKLKGKADMKLVSSLIKERLG